MKRQDNIEMMITRDRDAIKLWKSIHPKMLTFKPACLFTGCTSFNVVCTCFNAIIEFSGTWVSFCDEKLRKIQSHFLISRTENLLMVDLSLSSINTVDFENISELFDEERMNCLTSLHSQIQKYSSNLF